MSFLLGCKTLWKLDKRIMVFNSQTIIFYDCWAVMYIPGRDLFIYPLTVCILGQAPVDMESIACMKESFVSECQLFPGERGEKIRSAELCFKNYRPFTFFLFLLCDKDDSHSEFLSAEFAQTQSHWEENYIFWNQLPFPIFFHYDSGESEMITRRRNNIG